MANEPFRLLFPAGYPPPERCALPDTGFIHALQLDQMIGSLQEYRDALEQGNGDRLCTLLAEGRICKEKVDGQ